MPGHPITLSNRPCQDCGRELVTQRAWNSMPRAERLEAMAEGFTRQGAGTRCQACYEGPRKRSARQAAA